MLRKRIRARSRQRRCASPRSTARGPSLRCWCCCTIPSSTTPISATATGCAGSASTWSCCSTTASSWPACSSSPACSSATAWREGDRRTSCGHRAWRLGVPFLISIFVLMPIAYYPTFLRYHLPGTTDFNFFHFWWHTLTIGPWPSGPAWFLWVLLALDAIAAAIWSIWRRARSRRSAGSIFALRNRPVHGFRRIPDLLDRDLSADAPDLRRCELARAGPISAADPDQPHPALCRLFLRRRRRRRGRT